MKKTIAILLAALTALTAAACAKEDAPAIPDDDAYLSAAGIGDDTLFARTPAPASPAADETVTVNDPAAEPDPALFGAWELYDGGDMPSKSYVSDLAGTGISLLFVFHEDGSGYMKASGAVDSTDYFSYTFGNGYIVIDGGRSDYSIDGDDLTIDISGHVLVCRRK